MTLEEAKGLESGCILVLTANQYFDDGPSIYIFEGQRVVFSGIHWLDFGTWYDWPGMEDKDEEKCYPFLRVKMHPEELNEDPPGEFDYDKGEYVDYGDDGIPPRPFDEDFYTVGFYVKCKDVKVYD